MNYGEFVDDVARKSMITLAAEPEPEKNEKTIAANFPIKVEIDPSLPENVMELRDPLTGKVLRRVEFVK